MDKKHHMSKKYGNKVGNFSIQIEAFKQALGSTVNDAVLELYAGLVKGTPVGNPSLWLTKYPPKHYVGGTARANWRIVVTPDDEVIHSTSISAPPTLPTSWDKLYIVNNVPYIIPLEYGHSKQVEPGWIRKNIDNFQQLLSELSRARLK